MTVTPKPAAADRDVYAELDALAARVAMLEAVLGRADDVTNADLPDAVVASMSGGASGEQQR